MEEREREVGGEGGRGVEREVWAMSRGALGWAMRRAEMRRAAAAAAERAASRAEAAAA